MMLTDMVRLRTRVAKEDDLAKMTLRSSRSLGAKEKDTWQYGLLYRDLRFGGGVLSASRSMRNLEHLFCHRYWYCARAVVSWGFAVTKSSLKKSTEVHGTDADSWKTTVKARSDVIQKRQKLQTFQWPLNTWHFALDSNPFVEP